MQELTVSTLPVTLTTRSPEETEAVGAALAGMMAKHTVSVYDMIGTGKVYPMELWEEKIKDSINDLFLLWALLHEE
jgi:hypothetical protein